MGRKRLNINWKKNLKTEDFHPALKRHKYYLENNGFRKATIESYVGYIKRYLKFIGLDKPDVSDFSAFRGSLYEKGLSRSSINNYCFAIKRYHEMMGKSIEFTVLKNNDEIPYYFDEDDVLEGMTF